MGFVHNTYLGPFARCAVEWHETTETGRGCTKCGDMNVSGAFCSRCGGEIGAVEYTTREAKIDAWEVHEEMEDALTPPSGDDYLAWAEENKCHLWMANIPMPGRKPNLDPCTIAAFTAYDISEEIDKFRRAFSGCIRILESFYGVGNVTIEWGIIQDYI